MDKPIEGLTCSCCGGPARGRQWYNRDTGYGLCDKCAQWIKPRETTEYMEECYGIEGYNYSIKEDKQ
jgi:hypothetical protein